MQGNEPQNPRLRELELAKEIGKQGRWEEAYDIAYKWYKLDADDHQALNVIAYIMSCTDKVAIAYPILRHLTTIAPEYSAGWLNLGHAAADLWRYNEAKRAYKKAIKLASNDEERSAACVNMASTMVDHGDFAEAEKYAEESIRLYPDTVKGKANLGFCQLAQRKWVPGWENYRHCLDSESRPLTQYNNEPLWTGEKGVICVYSEQGLGDEISFGQMLPQMQAWCDENDSRLIVDVNPRLESLFKRSFPDIEIHGTRGVRQITWDPREIEYSLPMAQLGETFRTKDEDFTGVPYLVPDPDRVYQWKSLFETKDKPVIGIAWRGGIWKTAAKYRQLDLEQLLPVLKSVDAHWVSLQYKPAGKEIEAFREKHDIDIIEYPYCTLSNDYDDTVAMVAALDHVIAMQTTIVHVAGGLGIPCWAFVPPSSQWRYGQEHEDFVWANSVRLIRQKKRGYWKDVMQETGDELANFRGLQAATAADAPIEEDQLRHSGKRVRRDRRANDRLNGGRPSA